MSNRSDLISKARTIVVGETDPVDTYRLLRFIADGWEQDAARLDLALTAIKDAPHGDGCKQEKWRSVYEKYPPVTLIALPSCDCWKSRALRAAGMKAS